MDRELATNHGSVPQTESKLDNEERQLQSLWDRYWQFHESAPIGYFTLDAHSTILDANISGARLLGTAREKLLGSRLTAFVAAPFESNFNSFVENIVEREEWHESELEMGKTDGSRFYAMLQGRRITSAEELAIFVSDITKFKLTENALKESERKYWEVADLLAEGIFEADLSGNVTYANNKTLSSLGFSESDLKNGLNIFDVIARQNLDLARERFARVLKKEDVGCGEYLLMRKDGTTFPALVHSLAVVREGVVMGIRGILVDISDRKQAEQALRESEERFRTLLKSLHEGIWVLDEDDRTTFVNPRMAEMLGYTEEEMLGKPVYSFNDEEWRKSTVVYMDRRKQGISEQLEGELLRKDGGRVYALLETSPILDEDGNYTGSIAGVQDITDRKLAEERLKQAMEELDRSNKELEQFAYVTSHDLREPLRMMSSFAQSLEKRYKGKLDNTADEYIHFIVDGAARMQRLIDDILIYSRVTTRALPFSLVEMERVFQEVLLNLKAATEETKAKITHDPLPVIQADPAQMTQVLQNLIGNAVKFYREEESPIVHVSSRREGKEWVFSIKDNGIGIDPELFGRLFNLFQRLHPQDKYPGTGVGLAVAKKIVQRHGGRIWVESEPGKGSKFCFSIPQ